LQSGKSLATVALLDTNMDVVGSGSNVGVVTERVPFVSKGICLQQGGTSVDHRHKIDNGVGPPVNGRRTVGIEVLYAHAMNRKRLSGDLWETKRR
jgi:hypothetical protein